MQQIVPFVFYANANASPAGEDCAVFVTVQCLLGEALIVTH